MIQGIHHITAIASDAQKNYRFYTHVLGLRLVKKTVNQDDVGTYHLFYGDKEGFPGMDLTFFIFLPSTQGKRGNGLVTKISFQVPEQSLPFWENRFKRLQVNTEGLSKLFDRKRLIFFDHDDQQLELVGIPEQELEDKEIWTTEDVSSENAIRSFHSATLRVSDIQMVEPILTTVFGYVKKEREENIFHYSLPDSKRANIIEVHEDSSLGYGINAAGTVHHIAFRAKNESEQSHLQKRVQNLGIQTTDVIDRFYFKSVYFRIPGGILFEIATDGPGFTADESEKTLGEHLALPPFLEHQRIKIESALAPIVLNEK